MVRFTIQYFADLCCPWCYVGWKNMDNAIQDYQAKHPDSEFEVLWNPYYLNPTAGTSSYEKRALPNPQSPYRTAHVASRIEQAASAAGITLQRRGKTGNTRAAHGLVLAAQARSPDLRDRVVAALFGATWEGEEDISDRAFLARCAVRLGVFRGSEPNRKRRGPRDDDGGDDDDEEEQEALRWLDSPEATQAADAGMELAQEMGIAAVPTWVVQGRYRVGGCQGAPFFTTLFDKIRMTAGDGQD